MYFDNAIASIDFDGTLYIESGSDANIERYLYEKQVYTRTHRVTAIVALCQACSQERKTKQG